MSKTGSEVFTSGVARDRGLEWAEQGAIIVGASLLVALCARISVPLPFTPVPLTMQNFGVLIVGMLLGSRRGFAALALYLAEGLAGFPVFSPTGPGGLAQLIGPTGGFLMAYPFVAALAGWVVEKGRNSFARSAIAGLLAEILLFVGGLSWLFFLTHSIAVAFRLGFYGFAFAEVIKIMLAAGSNSGMRRFRKAER